MSDAQRRARRRCVAIWDDATGCCLRLGVVRWSSTKSCAWHLVAALAWLLVETATTARGGNGRGPDADRKPAWGASSAGGGGGGGGVAAADRAWPRPARSQQHQRPVFAGRVFMTAADAGGPGGGALTFGGGRGAIIDPRAMDLDLSNLTRR
ncbi:hypothetical protein MRX96_051279 [Rhipicephalus microplus]